MNPPKQALVFYVGESRYAMDILHLKEVGRMPMVERTPNAPVGVLGVIRMHGKPVRVFDMAALLRHQTDAEEPPPVSRPWVVVGHTSEGDAYWRVDTVEDIVDFDPDLVVPDGAGDAPALIDLEDGLTHLLTPEFLCSRQRN